MIKAKYFALFVFIFSNLADLTMYLLARIFNETKPWPAESITNTSNNYPGYIVFRGVMIYCVPIM